LLAPPGLPGWIYGPVKGESLLRTMVRARVLASQEAGREERGESLLVQGQEQGVELAGYLLSAAMAQQLQAAQPAALPEIAQDLIEGSPLWLRAEPETDADQADPRLRICPDASHSFVEPQARIWLQGQILAALRYLD
jgi:hypothetical protein